MTNNPIEGEVTPHVDEETVVDLGDIGKVDIEDYKHEALIESLPGGNYPEVDKKLDELRKTVYETISANSKNGGEQLDPLAVRERQLKFRLGVVAYEKWKKEGGKLPENPEDDKFINVA